MRTINRTDYTVAACFISVLINDDISGIHEEDIKPLNAFLSTLPHNGHWSINSDQEAFFGVCKICGLYADCMVVTLIELK